MSSPEFKAQNPDIEIAKLAALRDALRIGKFKDYPENTDRLVASDLPRDEFGRIILPDGPWSIDTEKISAERYQQLQNRGLEFDSQNRPLHPLFHQLVQDPEIGAVTGRGFFWEFGPNETADAAVIRRDLSNEPWILLIQRNDNKQFALPGGFLEDKTALETAVAEPKEEAFMHLDDLAQFAIHSYSGAVADIRTTAHAWVETNVFIFELPDAVAMTHKPGSLLYKGGDDANKVLWVPFSHAEEIVQPAHKLLIQAITPQVIR